MSRPVPCGAGRLRVAVWPCLMSGVACCPDRFLAAAWPALVGLAAVCAGGRRPVAWLVAPTDLRPPRGLPARSPSAPRALLGASSRSPARPRRRPRSPQPGPAADSRRSQASASSGALHTSGACRSGVPGQAPPPTLTNFARNSPATVSNLECASLELQRFQRLLKLLSIELRASFPGPAVYRELRQPVRG